ncbi:hypothetical protein [Pararhodobacter sp.]|uniref:hypothetical protein n=1 Tax=Pararhodobacter sp. TaxID=2127056 RepID=UPI002AFF792D|nr:hypothetical protein [Pararhodobacter sp.]
MAFPTARDALYGNPPAADHRPDKAVFRDYLESLEAMLAAGTIKGFADAVAGLPGSGNTIGDLRIVLAEPAADGGVYQWDGTDWGLIAALPTVFWDDAYARLSQAWAEGTLPGGPGTKSALEHAADAGADALATAADRVQTGLDRAAAAASATAASLSEQQSQAAAVLAGAPIAPAFPTDDTETAALASPFLFVAPEGMQSWTHSGTFASLVQGDYVSRVEFDDVTALLAYNGPALPVNLIVRTRAEGHSYRVVASGGNRITDGGVHLEIVKDIADLPAWGVRFNGTDESAIVQSAIDASLVFRVPAGKILVVKNIELPDGCALEIDGTLKLPDGCVDFDRLLYGHAKTDISGRIDTFDGNSGGQTGSIGTHLLYLTSPQRCKIQIERVKDHYIAIDAPMPSVDGIRSASSGAVYVYAGVECDIPVVSLRGWGREGVWFEDCADCVSWMGFAQATGNTEWSAHQMSGPRNKMLRGSADKCGASAFGFDVPDGSISNIIVTNNRENAGVNFGHPGKPASRSVASNIVVDGSFLAGISVSADTEKLRLDNFALRDCGERGLQQSDGSTGLVAANGIVSRAGRWNVVTSGAGSLLTLANVDSADLDAGMVHLTGVVGDFEDGEEITDGVETATVRRVLRNLTGVQVRLLLSAVSGSFGAASTITGATSGAAGTLALQSTPVQYNEGAGSKILDNTRQISGAGSYVAHPDGTAEWVGVITVVVATGGVDTLVTVNFNTGMTFISAPIVLASPASFNAVTAHTINKLYGSATTSAITIRLNASVAQTYGISVIARGRWR